MCGSLFCLFLRLFFLLLVAFDEGSSWGVVSAVASGGVGSNVAIAIVSSCSPVVVLVELDFTQKREDGITS